MEPVCSHCGEHLANSWTFCARCGARIDSAPASSKTSPEAEKAPLSGAFGGLYLGLIASPIMVIVGTMLCLTGLGAFVGIPMIIGGILAPLAGPVFGMGAVKGKFL